MSRLKTMLFSAALIAAAGGLILFPTECRTAAQEGLRLSFEVVLPSLFPFFVLSQLLVSGGAAESLARVLAPYMRRLFGVGGSGAAALLLGLAGGYPLGAKTVAELYTRGDVTRSEGEQLLAFCSNSGPGFFLGICAAQFAAPRAGIYLYLIHAFSAILCGILLRRKLPISLHRPHGAKKSTSPAAIFPAAVQNAFSSVWNVCGFVVLFMVLLRLLSLLPGLQTLSTLPRAALYGFVEMTNGILALPASRKGFILCAALTGWGGLSVHAQTLALLRTTDLSARRYFGGKLLHALLSALMAALISCHLG